MFQAIGPPAKHNRYFELRQILLRGNLSIDSDKGIELLLSQREQVTILDSSPAATRNRNNRMVGEFSRQSPIDALIRCPRSSPLAGLRLSRTASRWLDSSSKIFTQQRERACDFSLPRETRSLVRARQSGNLPGNPRSTRRLRGNQSNSGLAHACPRNTAHRS